jgi:uracil-DNA glycosylase
MPLIHKEEELASLLANVRACTACADALPLGPRPILQSSTDATILIASQAPGSTAHRTGVPFSDPSGDRLREWMRSTKDEFYDQGTIAIVPMGFCYPGRAGGGDAPPRPECVDLWRNRLLQLLRRCASRCLSGAMHKSTSWGAGRLRQG